jgi:hypothetical protein
VDRSRCRAARPRLGGIVRLPAVRSPCPPRRSYPQHRMLNFRRPIRNTEYSRSIEVLVIIEQRRVSPSRSRLHVRKRTRRCASSPLARGPRLCAHEACGTLACSVSRCQHSGKRIFTSRGNKPGQARRCSSSLARHEICHRPASRIRTMIASTPEQARNARWVGILRDSHVGKRIGPYSIWLGARRRRDGNSVSCAREPREWRRIA